VLARDLESDPWPDDLGGLDRAGQRARDHDVGLDPLRCREVVLQRFGLPPPEVREAGTAEAAADHPVEAGVSVAVTDEKQSALAMCGQRLIKGRRRSQRDLHCIVVWQVVLAMREGVSKYSRHVAPVSGFGRSTKFGGNQKRAFGHEKIVFI